MLAKLTALLNGSALQRAEQRLAQLEAVLEAVDKTQARIEFDLDGHILDANKAFLDLMGYQLPDIQGRHHRIFLDDEEANSAKYKAFWSQLRRGECQSGEFKRLTKHDSEVWIQAAYNPVFDADGQVTHFVKEALNKSPKSAIIRPSSIA